MRQGVKTLQVRAGTVSRGHTHKGKVSGSHEAGGANREREAEKPPFFAFCAHDVCRALFDPAFNRTARPRYGCRRLSRLQQRSLLPERFELAGTLARGTRCLRHPMGCDFRLDLGQISEPCLGACGLSLHVNLRLFVYDGVGLTSGQGRGPGPRQRPRSGAWGCRFCREQERQQRPRENWGHRASLTPALPGRHDGKASTTEPFLQWWGRDRESVRSCVDG